MAMQLRATTADFTTAITAVKSEKPHAATANKKATAKKQQQHLDDNLALKAKQPLRILATATAKVTMLF